MPSLGTKPQKAPVAPPVLLEKTQKVIGRIEALRGEPLMCYWNSPSSNIAHNDVSGFYGTLRSMGKMSRMSMFIKSDGGSGQAALRMINLLRQFVDRLTVLVPLECQSAATMVALGADVIQMGPLAHLSAVDTSLTHDLSPLDRDNDRVSVSQDELHRLVTLWKKHATQESSNPYGALFPYIHPLVIGAVDRASALSSKLCLEILSYHLKDERKAQEISDALNSSYPSHTYPITLREARRIGLNVEPLNEETNDLLFELNEIYSEMGQRAYVDFDEQNAHDNSIITIIEGGKKQIFYQLNKDWHYRTSERRWVSLNDKSGWKRAETLNNKLVINTFHVR